MRQKCIYILAELIYECERKIVANLPFATISERIVTTSKMSLPTAYIQHSNETVYSFPFGTSAAFIFLSSMEGVLFWTHPTIQFVVVAFDLTQNCGHRYQSSNKSHEKKRNKQTNKTESECNALFLRYAIRMECWWAHSHFFRLCLAHRWNSAFDFIWNKEKKG